MSALKETLSLSLKQLYIRYPLHIKGSGAGYSEEGFFLRRIITL